MKQQYEQRVMETKKKIYDAFACLMRRKSIHQISISELCQLAEINRSTFYHHYGSQYDVLREMTDLFLAQLEERLQNVSPYDKAGVQRRVEMCLDFAAENNDLTLLLMENTAGTDFAKRLFSLPKIEFLLNEKLSCIQDEAERQASISFVTYGAYQLLLEWLNTPERVSAKQEAELILKLARKIC
ncbi:MAG: TetR/AcrR family transcriptional regulator [Lachnospiraceae bacterium]|nr:TetR/AcrR family transcriptional regulator [Lachnospiraceae bacterium]